MFQLYKDLVVSELITADEFWTRHSDVSSQEWLVEFVELVFVFTRTSALASSWEDFMKNSEVLQIVETKCLCYRLRNEL